MLKEPRASIPEESVTEPVMQIGGVVSPREHGRPFVGSVPDIGHGASAWHYQGCVASPPDCVALYVRHKLCGMRPVVCDWHMRRH
jgi:hypothetical protein